MGAGERHRPLSGGQPPYPAPGQLIRLGDLTVRYLPDGVIRAHPQQAYPDHVGWLTPDDTSSEPTFPNAEHFVGDGEFDFWGQAANMARLTAPTPRQYGVIAARRRDLRTGDVPRPGIEALLTPGHTPGHVSFVLHGGGSRRAIVVGDAMHTVAEVLYPDMCWTGDLDPTAATASRHALVAELSRPDTLTIGPHFTGTVFPTRG